MASWPLPGDTPGSGAWPESKPLRVRARLDELTDGRCHLLGEHAQLAVGGDRQDEAADPCFERERGELLSPCGRRPLAGIPAGPELPVDVVHPANVGRAPARAFGTLVDPRAHPGQLTRLGVAEARQPAVGLGAGEREHSRLVCAEPDLHPCTGAGPRCAPTTR